MAQITKNEEQAAVSILTAMNELPLERKMYLLGYAQGVADRALPTQSDGRK